MATHATYVRHRIFLDVLGEELWIAEDREGALYFPVRPSCKVLGIDSTTALETIKADSRLNVGLAPIRLPTENGGDQEQQCLQRLEYSWWLALIDPRRFAEAKRGPLQERQRALMQMASEIMLKRSELRMLPSAAQRKPLTPQTGSVTQTGAMEGQFRCLRCGAPHNLTIDGQGWHLHAGVEVE